MYHLPTGAVPGEAEIFGDQPVRMGDCSGSSSAPAFSSNHLPVVFPGLHRARSNTRPFENSRITGSGRPEKRFAHMIWEPRRKPPGTLSSTHPYSPMNTSGIPCEKPSLNFCTGTPISAQARMTAF